MGQNKSLFIFVLDFKVLIYAVVLSGPVCLSLSVIIFVAQVISKLTKAKARGTLNWLECLSPFSVVMDVYL